MIETSVSCFLLNNPATMGGRNKLSVIPGSERLTVVVDNEEQQGVN
jgi:hypothetical protein